MLSNLSVIPSDALAYDTVWRYLVTLAIPLLLFKADLKRILREVRPALAVFGIGSVRNATGYAACFPCNSSWRSWLAVSWNICSTYIGGPMNFVAAAEALGHKSGDVLGGGVAGNLVMTFYFFVLFSLPSIRLLCKFYPSVYKASLMKSWASSLFHTEKAGLTSISWSFALAFVICALSFRLAEYLPVQELGILIVTVLTVLTRQACCSCRSFLRPSTQARIFLSC